MDSLFDKNYSQNGAKKLKTPEKLNVATHDLFKNLKILQF